MAAIATLAVIVLSGPVLYEATTNLLSQASQQLPAHPAIAPPRERGLEPEIRSRARSRA
jgi:hypothetical protein